MAGTFSLSKQKERLINANPEDEAREMAQGADLTGQKCSDSGDFKPFPTITHHDVWSGIDNSSEKNELEIHSFSRFSNEEDERDLAISALVENIQGHDMNFFDEASAISKLIRYYGLTQEDAAQKLGRAQSTIANKLRLLRLTDNERDLILSNKLTERHARSLLKLASPEDRMLILDKIIDNNLNVERAENMIENFIGRQKERNNYKKRSKVYQNVNSFINTINRAVESMQANGIIANSRKLKGDDYIEFRVRIALKQ